MARRKRNGVSFGKATFGKEIKQTKTNPETKYIKERKRHLKELRDLSYTRLKLNKDIRDIKREMKVLDNALLNGGFK